MAFGEGLAKDSDSGPDGEVTGVEARRAGEKADDGALRQHEMFVNAVRVLRTAHALPNPTHKDHNSHGRCP